MASKSLADETIADGLKDAIKHARGDDARRDESTVVVRGVMVARNAKPAEYVPKAQVYARLKRIMAIEAEMKELGIKEVEIKRRRAALKRELDIIVAIGRDRPSK